MTARAIESAANEVAWLRPTAGARLWRDAAWSRPARACPNDRSKNVSGRRAPVSNVFASDALGRRRKAGQTRTGMSGQAALHTWRLPEPKKSQLYCPPKPERLRLGEGAEAGRTLAPAESRAPLHVTTCAWFACAGRGKHRRSQWQGLAQGKWRTSPNNS